MFFVVSMLLSMPMRCTTHFAASVYHQNFNTIGSFCGFPDLKKVHGFSFGDSADEWKRTQWQDFDARLQNVCLLNYKKLYVMQDIKESAIGSLGDNSISILLALGSKLFFFLSMQVYVLIQEILEAF